MLNVEVRFLLVGEPPRLEPFITIDGRQALRDGPRKVGHCIHCVGQCAGVTADCELRVRQESTCPYKDAHLKRF